MRAGESLLSMNLGMEHFKKSVVLHIPHSSPVVPDYVVDDYDKTELYKNILVSTDWCTDEIFIVPDCRRIVCKFSRMVCDVERWDDDSLEPMSKIGRGFYYTHGYDGKRIRDDNQFKKHEILEEFYKPHHRILESLVDRSLDDNGMCYLIDCHSFNEDPVCTNSGSSSPDICIGTDDFHTPCWFSHHAVRYWSELGYSVSVNAPYSGCIIPRKHYRESNNVFGIMIEINKRLYMNGSGCDNDAVRKLHDQFEKFLG